MLERGTRLAEGPPQEETRDSLREEQPGAGDETQSRNFGSAQHSFLLEGVPKRGVIRSGSLLRRAARTSDAHASGLHYDCAPFQADEIVGGQEAAKRTLHDGRPLIVQA